MPKFQVKRSILIDAPADKVFDTVCDFGTWTKWSPWLCAEPEAKVTISDDANSVGSTYQWNGEIVGQGEIEHKQINRTTEIEEELRIIKPFKSKSQVRFLFQPVDEKIQVTWQMNGSLPWFLFWMKSQMMTIIGMDYERGLKMLKDYVETGFVPSKTTIMGMQSIGPLAVLGVRKQCTLAEIGPSMSAAFKEVESKLEACDDTSSCEGISIYHDFDMKAQTCDYTSGMILPELPESIPDGLTSWSMPSKQAFRVDHLGKYDHLGNAWSAANQYVRYHKITLSPFGFEIYKNDPKETAEADLISEVYLPMK